MDEPSYLAQAPHFRAKDTDEDSFSKRADDAYLLRKQKPTRSFQTHTYLHRHGASDDEEDTRTMVSLRTALSLSS